ncbi:unnamed protein product [Rhizoctonia solani]|uniref:Uncharacterized protein n=1 Tax=Rhizoctonia solani TaxID=456999 RepID=A0A8H3CSE2_9AGAM|nr:unnamed protein product [Rhizoctonia solani]
MTSNVQKALLLSEIVQQITSYCGYREQRDLAYTCRWLFSLVTPVIWKEVSGVETVIKLIPGAKVSEGYNTRRYSVKAYSMRIGPDIGTMHPLFTT